MVIHESLLLPTASQNPRWLNVRHYLSKKELHSGSDSNPHLGCACNQKISMSQESPRAQSLETMSVFSVLSKKCQELESGMRRVGGLWFLSVFLWCGYKLEVNKFIRKKIIGLIPSLDDSLIFSAWKSLGQAQFYYPFYYCFFKEDSMNVGSRSHFSLGIRFSRLTT